MVTNVVLAALMVAIYAAYAIARVRGTRGLSIKTVPRRWYVPGVTVRVSGGAVEVEGVLATHKMNLSAVRGVWWAPKWAIEAIDKQLLGAVFFDERGRSVRIPGWHVREGLGQAERAMVLERTDALLEELSRGNLDWRPKRVKGFLAYRLLLAATTAALIVVAPLVFFLLRSLEGWPRDVGEAIVPAVIVAWIPSAQAVWRVLVRYQLKHNKEAFWRPGRPDDAGTGPARAGDTGAGASGAGH